MKRFDRNWPIAARRTAPLQLAILLTLALLAWLLAYQLPLAQTIHVGGETALQRREDDAPFLRGFNGSQPADRIDAADDPRGYRWWFEESRRTGERPYRWTTADSTLLVPGAGGGAYLVELLARNGRPDQQPVQTTWTAGDGPPLALSLAAGAPRRYRLLVPADGAGNLRLALRSEAFTPPGDPRELGFVLHEVRLRAVDDGLRAPSWPTVGWLALAVGALYGLARVLRAGPTFALALAGGATLAAALCLAAARPALTLFAPALGLLALSCTALAAAAWPLVLLAVRQGIAHDEAAQLLGLVLLAFALRMGGMLHPQALFSDLGLHANNLFEVTLGQVFFSEGLPSDAGGGRAPYPPGFYLALLPGELLAAGGEARRLLVQGGTAMLDSLAIVVVWGLLRRAGLGVPGAALGAACYLLPTPALEAFSIGEYANLGGQALALPLLALLGLGGRWSVDGGRWLANRGQDHSRRWLGGGGRWSVSAAVAAVPRPSPALMLAAAVALALLAHSGVTLSVGAVVASAWGLAWLGRLRGRDGPLDPLLLSLSAAAGLGLALLIYYSAPAFVSLILGRADRPAGAGDPLSIVLVDTARALLGLAPPQDTRVALPPLIGPLGIAGLLLALRSGEPRMRPVRLLLAAWWLGAGLTLALLVVSGQGVRWAIFLYPALCLGAGVALDALWRRGLPGRLVALGLLTVMLGAGLLTWIVTVRDFIHA